MKMTKRKFVELAGLPFLVLGARALCGGPGSPKRRWGMAVDIGKCAKDKGCTLCIDACHRSHNVPRINDHAHEVKWVWKEPFEKVFPTADAPAALNGTPLVVLCNHCDNPPCARACPTGATWKRDDGIVMMDPHRCIGCRYCIAACPYGARSFNWLDPRPYVHGTNPAYPGRTKGVVEKCTFCEERLAVGKKPLCVEACPEKALVFGNLADPASEISQLLRYRYSIRRRPELGTRPSVFYSL